MLRPLVVLSHPDPVVEELIRCALEDEFDVRGTRTGSRLIDLVTGDTAVAVLDVGAADVEAVTLGRELRAAHPRLRLIFLAPQHDPRLLWTLLDLGAVLPKGRDLDRLRFAIRKEARLHAMSGSVDRLRVDTERTTQRPGRPRPSTY